MEIHIYASSKLLLMLMMLRVYHRHDRFIDEGYTYYYLPYLS